MRNYFVTVCDKLIYHIFVARWQGVQYTIKFAGNGATSGTMSSLSERQYGKTYTLTVNAFKRTGYTFAGWYFDSEYTQKADYIEEYTCKDITLYALWLNNEYTIHYELGAVEQSVYPTQNPNPDKYKYNSELILLDATTNDPAFVFDGWYTDEFFTWNFKYSKRYPSRVDNNIYYARAVYEF